MRDGVTVSLVCLLFCGVSAMSVLSDRARGAAPEAEKAFPIYDGTPPAALGNAPADIPTLTFYPPAVDKARTGPLSVVVVLPGGGYGGLADHESVPVGKWLADHGIAAFVLRYRLGPKYHHPVEWGDASRAIRVVRANAAPWNIDPAHIGILGFSAGGHLASSVATHFTAGDVKAVDLVERVSSRPDAEVLIYPVISLGATTHSGSLHNLLGNSPDPKLMEYLSSEKQVTKDTPPAFVVHSTQDKAVPVNNSDMYVQALKDHNVAVKYIRGEYGDHGFGLKDFWTASCIEWLHTQGF